MATGTLREGVLLYWSLYKTRKRMVPHRRWVQAYDAFRDARLAIYTHRASVSKTNFHIQFWLQEFPTQKLFVMS